MTSLRVFLAFWIALSLAMPPAFGQSEFGTTLKKKYKLRTVACQACHRPDEEESKETLNDLGKTLAKLIEGKGLSDMLEEAGVSEGEEKEKLKEAVEKEFLEVLKKLDEMPAPSGKKYAEAIPAGEIEGAKPRK
jgi:hypothetical protein